MRHQMSPNVQVECASIEQRIIVENLIQLYVHDFTEYVPMTLRSDGRFEYSRLPLYWTEVGRHPFIFKADGRLAGFALVKKGSEFSGDESVWEMAEFFVVRGERGRGVGYAVAANIWRQLTGPWEVRVLPNNVGALHFWSTSIARFLDGPVEPVHVQRGDESRSLFLFESSPVRQ
ncbi:MAG: GNAT family N-acetyltransferase [Acidobacteriaceae bacterium]